MAIEAPAPKAKKNLNTTVANPPQAIVLPIPEPGSLRHVIVTNPQKRLYIHPALWTRETLGLLECYLDPGECPPLNNEEPLESFEDACFKSHPKYGKVLAGMKRIVEKQKTKQFKIYKDLQLRANLPDLVDIAGSGTRVSYNWHGLRDQAMVLDFLYNQKRAVQVQMPGMVWGSTGNPLCAYFDQSWYLRKETKLLKYRQSKNWTPFTYDLWYDTGKSIDPYYVAILIAMAQRCCGSAKEGCESQSRIKVHLLTSADYCDHLILYTAKFTHEFLAKFESPYQYFGPQRVTINQERIPISPPTQLLYTMRQMILDETNTHTPAGVLSV